MLARGWNYKNMPTLDGFELHTYNPKVIGRRGKASCYIPTKWDLNRLVQANLYDVNDVQLKYNAYDDVILAKDNHTQVAFDYTILGSLVSREQGGKKVKFTYDTEEQLTAVINEKGEAYQFERDTKGNIIKEIGFDEMEKTYERSKSRMKVATVLLVII